MSLQAARSWSERPTAFLGHKVEPGSWSARDRELAKALLLWEGSKCSGCGHPAHETEDPDREGWYLVEPVSCAACRAIATEAADGHHDPGTRFRAALDPKYVKRS